jgi:hypothetical protein
MKRKLRTIDRCTHQRCANEAIGKPFCSEHEFLRFIRAEKGAKRRPTIKTNMRMAQHKMSLQGMPASERSRWDRINNTYNITKPEFDKMVLKQDGLCAICLERTTKMVVDHCHSTGIVRGLLCNSCNLGLGSFKDNTDSLERARAYIETFLGKCGLRRSV